MAVQGDLDFGTTLLNLKDKQLSPIFQLHMDIVFKTINNM